MKHYFKIVIFIANIVLTCNICNTGCNIFLEWKYQFLVVFENTGMYVLSRWATTGISVSFAQGCRYYCSTSMPRSLFKNSLTARCLLSSMWWSRKAQIRSWLSSVPETKTLIDQKKQFPSLTICLDVWSMPNLRESKKSMILTWSITKNLPYDTFQ